MIVLSVHDGHDSGAALLQDGKLLCCSSEERRRNVENYAGVPELSIAAVFNHSQVDPQDVDLVATSGRIRTTAPTREHKPIYSVLTLLYSLARTEAATAAGQWLLSKVRKRRELMTFLERFGLGDKPVRTYDHHLTHAACAYYHRPWDDDATVLTLDGAGDGLCATVSVGSGDRMEVVARTPKFHSLAAWMYSAITAHLGLKPYEHEYKIMGMAPYGQPEHVAPILRRMFSVRGLRFRNDTGRIGRNMQRLIAERLYGQRFDNIAAGCQLVFEQMMLEWVANAVAATGRRKVAGAGGAVGELREHFVHYSFSKGLAPWLTKHNGYSQMEAHEAIRARGDKAAHQLRDLFSQDGWSLAWLMASYEYMIGLLYAERQGLGLGD